jgi:hypothetical protein
VEPAQTGVTDIVLEGKIIESTGEKLQLEITASDSSGAKWYTRRYEGTASKYSYDAKRGPDPFQDIYNRISNDLALYRAKLQPAQVRELRTISELRFAESFSPQAFGGYLRTDKRGIYRIQRLPADNDPMLVRIRQIREPNLFRTHCRIITTALRARSRPVPGLAQELHRVPCPRNCASNNAAYVAGIAQVGRGGRRHGEQQQPQPARSA